MMTCCLLPAAGAAVVVSCPFRAKGWEEAFCSWAAVLLAATDESHW